MGQVSYDLSTPLDGFITGANVRPQAGLRDGGQRLHEWGLNSKDLRHREMVEG